MGLRLTSPCRMKARVDRERTEIDELVHFAAKWATDLDAIAPLTPEPRRVAGGRSRLATVGDGGSFPGGEVARRLLSETRRVGASELWRVALR